MQYSPSLLVFSHTINPVPLSPLYFSRIAPVINTLDSSLSVSPISSLQQSPSLFPICLSNWSINSHHWPLAPLSPVSSLIVMLQESLPTSLTPSPCEQPIITLLASVQAPLLLSPPSTPSSSQLVLLHNTLFSALTLVTEPRRSGCTNKGVPLAHFIKFCDLT